MGSQPNVPEQAQPPDQAPTGSNAAAGSTPPGRSPSPQRRRARDAHIDATATEDMDELAATYNTLRDITHPAFASEHLAVAYHALAGALHAAQDLHNQARLEEVQVIAQEQLRTIDSSTPLSPFFT